MDTIRFQTWWRQFERRVEGEGCHEIARRLRAKLRRTRVADRPEFVRELWDKLLQRQHSYGVALLVLGGLSELERLRELARRLTPLPPPQPADEEAHLADLMRILAASNDDELLRPVETYLLERPISPYWATVPWALWPHRKRLFARAWQRYLQDVQPTDWKPTEVLECFLAEPDAVRLVRTTISDNHPEHWNDLRDALIGEADQVGWLSVEQRESLDRVIY
ncbi:MAG TPA: hypothetical protein VD788_08665 [Candidatus Polarisedimenticolaceae bacterium]|nr:hypothetical protein [Candidatus Polarisedimenticolaceae bacterium]